MKYFFAIVFVCISFFIVSCAHQIPPVLLNYKPDNQSAIIYGRFIIGSDFAFGNRLALWLQNLDDKKSIYIYFDRDQPLYAIQAEPGQYQVTGVAGIDMTHRILGRRRFQSNEINGVISVPFKASANTAIYIGDFDGKAQIDGLTEEWQIESLTNNFSETTKEFHQKYLNLLAIPVISAFEPEAKAP
jgi:hypothetical protein